MWLREAQAHRRLPTLGREPRFPRGAGVPLARLPGERPVLLQHSTPWLALPFVLWFLAVRVQFLASVAPRSSTHEFARTTRVLRRSAKPSPRPRRQSASPVRPAGSPARDPA